jgi:Peptidase inhibitor I9
VTSAALPTPTTLRRKLVLTVSTSMLIAMASLAGIANSVNNQPMAAAQENNSNISSSLQVGNVTNMSGFTGNESENATRIENITEISNATSGEAIPLQQIVTLKNSAPDSVFNDVVSEVKSKGAEIIYNYKDLLNAFAFRAPNDQVLMDIVTDLKNNPSVASVTTDKTAGIMPE